MSAEHFCRCGKRIYGDRWCCDACQKAAGRSASGRHSHARRSGTPVDPAYTKGNKYLERLFGTNPT